MQEGQTCIDCHKGIAHPLPVRQPAGAATQPAADPGYGEEINVTCDGYHGENGEGSADGEYPCMAGMSPGYIARQLRHFKARERIRIPKFRNGDRPHNKPRDVAIFRQFDDTELDEILAYLFVLDDA